MAADGLTTIPSNFGPDETLTRLQAAVTGKGMAVFARIDHAAGAAEVGLSLAPTTLLIFGAARGGTPLMLADQTVGIDLPLKALVWRGGSGRTWLSYDDPAWIARRHGLGAKAEPVTNAMAKALSSVAAEACGAGSTGAGVRPATSPRRGSSPGRPPQWGPRGW